MLLGAQNQRLSKLRQTTNLLPSLSDWQGVFLMCHRPWTTKDAPVGLRGAAARAGDGLSRAELHEWGFPSNRPVRSESQSVRRFWFQMEKLNLGVCCGQGFPQRVIASDNFRCVGFGFRNSMHCSFRAWRLLHRRC